MALATVLFFFFFKLGIVEKKRKYIFATLLKQQSQVQRKWSCSSVG